MGLNLNMQIRMNKVECVILCEAGGAEQCHILSRLLREMLTSTMKYNPVVIEDKWTSHTEARALHPLIDSATVVISIFAPSAKKVDHSQETLWRSLDEYAWYQSLIRPGLAQPRYIPVSIQEAADVILPSHLRTIRTGRLQPTWYDTALNTPQQQWNRSLKANLNSVIRALNKAFSLQLDLDILLLCLKKVVQKKDESEEPLAAAANDTNKESEGSKLQLTCELGSPGQCSVTVTCKELQSINMQPDPSNSNITMSMNLTF